MPSEKILEQKKQQVAELCEAFKAANVGHCFICGQCGTGID